MSTQHHAAHTCGAVPASWRMGAFVLIQRWMLHVAVLTVTVAVAVGGLA